VDTPFSWRVGYRMRSSSIVTLGANVHIESNQAGWGDSVGELFLGRPRCTLPGALRDPAGSMRCGYAGVMHCMPTRRNRAALALLVVAERNAALWPR
jgi:hypothetical protein